MERAYRRLMRPPDLVAFRVVVGETDLWVAARADLAPLVERRTKHHRRLLRAYMARDPGFDTDLSPRRGLPGAPPVVARMLAAGRAAGVGPMAAVAGALAQAVGEDLRGASPEIILENGGDLYVRSARARTVAVHAGGTVFGGRIGLVLPPCPEGLGVCTSAGTVGPSLSFGRADAATALGRDAALADAVATALGNRVGTAADLEPAVSWAAAIPGIRGALAVIGSRMAAAGGMELIPLPGGADGR